MAVVVTADTSEVTRLAADLVAAGAKVQVPVRNELRKAAVQVRRDAKAGAPKDTGALARSISYRARNRGLTYIVGPKQFYGRFLEFGTVKMRARPFMGPAAEGVADDLSDRVGDAAVGAVLGLQRRLPSSLV